MYRTILLKGNYRTDFKAKTRFFADLLSISSYSYLFLHVPRSIYESTNCKLQYLAR
jgi:hypothetical protein